MAAKKRIRIASRNNRMIVQCKDCGKVFGIIIKEQEDGVKLKKVKYLKMKCPYCGGRIEWGKKENVRRDKKLDRR